MLRGGRSQIGLEVSVQNKLRDHCILSCRRAYKLVFGNSTTLVGR